MNTTSRANVDWSKRMSTWYKSFSYNFEQYCGFSWPGWIRASIFVAFLAVLTGLMIRELSSNVDEFISNNIIPQINVIPPSDEVRPPNLTVCVPYYSDLIGYVANWVADTRGRNDQLPPTTPCDECEGMRNHSWDVWRMDTKMLTRPERPVYQLVPVLARKLFGDVEEARAALNVTNFNWNQVLVDSLWAFYSCLVATDRLFLTGDRLYNMHGDCEYFNFSSSGHIPDDVIDRYYDLLMDAIERYMHLEFELLDKTTIGGLKNVAGFFPISDKMCFPLPWNARIIRLDYRGQWPYSVNPYRPWKRPKASDVPTKMKIYEDAMFYDFLGDYRALYESEQGVLGNTKTWTVQLTYNIRTAIDVRGRGNPCSANSVPLSCMVNRQFHRATAECHCVPFLLRYLRGTNDTLPYCNESLYELCKHKLLREYKPDISYCNNQCEYTDYQYWPLMYQVNTEDEDFEFGLRIELIPANTSYVKFNFADKSTLGQFMSGVGGTLNLYMGLSGFSLCAFIYFLIDATKRWWRQRRGSVQPSNHPVGLLLGLRQFWFISALQATSKQDAGNASPVANDSSREQTRSIFKEIQTLKDEIAKLKDQFASQTSGATVRGQNTGRVTMQ